MLTNGESSKESTSSEANNINNEHIATEADTSDTPSNICEKSANETGEKSTDETGEKSANDIGEKSANDISEKSANDMNIDTTGNRVIAGEDDDILEEDAEVDFHTTLVNVWADISKELEVGFIVFSSEATL